jgi:hypothetical protein
MLENSVTYQAPCPECGMLTTWRESLFSSGVRRAHVEYRIECPCDREEVA